MNIQRHPKNPILSPNSNNLWEKKATFNGCVVKNKDKYIMLYRAQSDTQNYYGIQMSLSTIGIAESLDGVNFTKRRQYIKPEAIYELYGCEDPRIVKIEDKFYIFYTAISMYPPSAPGIKVALAITKDFETFEKRTLVTPFNAKACTLFPEKINGKFTAILTANTDNPPAKIALAQFEKEEDIWSENYWKKWYSEIDNHSLVLQKTQLDHVEVGAPPVKTEKGWLLIYSNIKNYFAHNRIFEIEGIFLDLNDPTKIIGRIKKPLLYPQEKYELEGEVPNIVFPTGAILENNELKIYYGGADTTVNLATVNINEIYAEFGSFPEKLERHKNNPILTLNLKNPWEQKAVFNPAVVYENGTYHMIYRAMSMDNTSVLAVATSKDGINFETEKAEIAYSPREVFEIKKNPGGLSGTEDPRITKIEDKFYMCYTAFDGVSSPRIAFTSIKVEDFVSHNWNWNKPVLISPPGIDDKDACVFPEKINGKYVFIHRFTPDIVFDFVDSLEFDGKSFLKDMGRIKPRQGMWDDEKIGINTVPFKTEFGWLTIYHGINSIDKKYRLGALLLKLDDPRVVLGRTEYPILEPEMPYEKEGMTKNVVFSCGMVVKDEEIIVYYGGADSVICVAKITLIKLLEMLKN